MRNVCVFFIYLKARCDDINHDIIFQPKNERVDHTVMANKFLFIFVAEACVIIILCASVKMICLNYFLLLLLQFLFFLGGLT
jgi:hypothetical protein